MRQGCVPSDNGPQLAPQRSSCSREGFIRDAPESAIPMNTATLMPTMTWVAEISVPIARRETRTPGVAMPGATGLCAPQYGQTLPAAISRPQVLQFIMRNSKLKGYTGGSVLLAGHAFSGRHLVGFIAQLQWLSTEERDMFRSTTSIGVAPEQRNLSLLESVPFNDRDWIRDFPRQ